MFVCIPAYLFVSLLAYINHYIPISFLLFYIYSYEHIYPIICSITAFVDGTKLLSFAYEGRDAGTVRGINVRCNKTNPR